MVNFRKTLMVVALLAVCAGLASAQMVINTKATTFTAALVRNEGVTELMPSVSFTVASTTAATSYDVTIVSTAPITSVKADLLFNGTAASTIVGNIATFSAVPFSATPGTFSLSGLRVDATQLPSLSSGLTSGLGENLIVVMSSTIGAPFTVPFDGTSPITTITGLAYAVKSVTVGTADALGSATGNSAPYTQCQTTPFDPTHAYLPASAAAAFTVSLAEGFGSAWQPKVANLPLWTGEGPGATQGTQFSLAFTNIPSNVTLYVPVSFNNAGLILNLVATSPTLDKDKVNAAVPASGMVVYEVVGATPAVDGINIPVYVSYNSGSIPSLTTSAAPITVTGAYAPQSTNGGVSPATGPIPRFLGTAQSSHAVGFTISPCNTTILFPYVVNQPGYDTGLAISNAGNLNPNGGQSGTCEWTFYGDNAPTSSTTTAAIAPGTTQTALLSGMAPGLTGFGVASCNFQGGYGYAFIVGSIGGNEVAQGYLALLGSKNSGSVFGFFPSVD